MKKSFLRLFLLMGMVVFFNQSCTNLDEEVFGEFTEENFPTNDLQFISALGATYTSLYNHGSHNSYFSLNEVSSDEIMIPHRGADWFDGGQWNLSIMDGILYIVVLITVIELLHCLNP